MKLSSILIIFLTLIVYVGECLAAPVDFQAELQWSICEKSPQEFLNKMKESFESKKDLMISYLDTVDLYYLNQGVIFRIIKKDDEMRSTVKIEIRHPKRVDWDWLENIEHKCEFNIYGNLEKLSCSIQNKFEGHDFLNREQDEMVSKVGGIRFNKSDLMQLKKVGPFSLKKWSSTYSDLVFESVEVPGLGSVMELSVRADFKDRKVLQAKIGQMLQREQISICSKQDGRTSKILEYLVQKK